MAREIDIQTVIEEIKSSLDILDISSYSEYNKGFDDGLEYVLDLIEKAPTLTQPNEPLTLEELREMDGKPVFLPKTNCWALATKDVFVMLLTFPDGEKCSANDWYKQVGPAYAYSFAHIDRAAWEPCGACKDGKITIHVPEFRAMAACNQHMDHGAFDLTLRLKFCPLCGRPLTEEAWAELEKRLRG